MPLTFDAVRQLRGTDLDVWCRALQARVVLAAFVDTVVDSHANIGAEADDMPLEVWAVQMEAMCTDVETLQEAMGR